MATDLQTYSRALAEQLRINGMQERRVSEVVAQVQEHVMVTGESPLEAFGQPVEYARQWKALTWGTWLRRLGGAAVGVTGLLLVLQALFAEGSWTSVVTFDSDDLTRWVLWVAIMAVVPWTLDLWLTRRRASNLGHTTQPADWLVRTGVIAAIIAIGLAVTVEGSVDGGRHWTLLEAPRWVCALLGVVGLPGMAYFGTSSNRSLPEPPGPVSWKTRVRRAFINR